MAQVRGDGVAVYVYRRTEASLASGLEFLQIHRSVSTGEYQQSWQVVYGGIEAGETALQAALREMHEEIGITPVWISSMFQVEYVETFYFRPHDYILMMPVWAVELEPNAPITLNHEHDGYRWVKAAGVQRDFMWRTQREALRVIINEIYKPGPARHFLDVDMATLRGGL